jgi:hypothetical protein
MANLTVGCPSIPNGCDDWDRLAYIDIKGPDGNWVQIIRYITPYGVACNHDIDLTDYASLEYINENDLLESSSDPDKTYIEEIMPAKLALNKKYIEEKSLGLDFKLIFKTISKLFKN